MNCKVRRMLAGVIDFYVICLLASIFVGIITLGQFSVTKFSIVIYLVSCFLLLLVKDITFKDASIGKRMLKQISTNATDGIVTAALSVFDGFRASDPFERLYKLTHGWK